MTPQDVLAQFRREMSDEELPYLWTDDEAQVYFIDAQNQMAKAVGGIADVTVASDASDADTRINDLVLTADEPYTALSPYILRIRSARLLGAGRDIPIINESDVNDITISDYGWTQGLKFDDTDTGDVTHGVLGVRDGYVRWLRVPDASDTVRLNYFRLPYPAITGFDDTTIQLAPDVHVHLVAGMRAKAYMKQDAETYDKGQAERMKAMFDGLCMDAKREVERKRYRPRNVMYGGL